ncbi:MAG: transcription antitermination factor NusB [Chlamydiales bacterium]
MAEIPPQKLRELVLQLLFSLDMGGEEASIDIVQREAQVSKKNAIKALEQAQAIFAGREGFDAQIAHISTEYAFERIAFLDRNILRLSLFEKAKGELPQAIVVAESLRLARKFSSKEAPRFINAILEECYGSAVSTQEGEATL